MERLLKKKFERNKPSLERCGAANGNQVGLQAGRRLARSISHNRLMLQKKDPGSEPEAFSPDGYSGGEGGAARLKYTPD